MSYKKPVAKKTENSKSGPHPALGHCQRMLSVFSDYLDRKSKNRICRKVKQHLRNCPDCRLYIDTLKKTVVLYRSLGQEPVPQEVQRRLFATIRLKGFMKKPKHHKSIKIAAPRQRR